MISEVYNCDCMEYMATLPNDFFDIAIADPPYRDSNSPTKWMQEKSSSKEMFLTGIPTNSFFKELKRVSKEQIIWGANNYCYPFKGFIAWDKMVRGSKRYSWVELASLSEGLGTVSTLVAISCYSKNDKIHPTEKPVELYAWIIGTYLPKIGGGKIFDPMMGSQSSRIAAYKLGYDFYGCELDKEYFDRGNERFERECNGIIKTSDGQEIKQLSIFDLC